MGEAGGSAERKFAELVAAGDPSAGAWAAGADGERRTAEVLATLGSGWKALHDRLLWPGLTDSNVDHIVVGPGGIFVIDTKNRAGDITVYQNGLYQHSFDASGARVSRNMQGELGKVTWTAGEMTRRLGVQVIPVICLAGSRSGDLKGVQFVQDVTVVGIDQLVGWLRAQAPRMPSANQESWVTRVMTEFPSTTTDPALLSAIGTDLRPHHRDKRRSRSTQPPPQPTPGPRDRSAKSAKRPKARPRKRRSGGVLKLLAGLAVVALTVTYSGEIAKLITGTFLPKAKSSVRAGGAATRVVNCAAIVTADLGGIASARVSERPALGCIWDVPAVGDNVGPILIRYLTSDDVQVYASSHTADARAAKKPVVVQVPGRTTTVYVGRGTPVDLGAGPYTLTGDARITIDHGELDLTDEQGLQLADVLLVRADMATTQGMAATPD